MSSLTVEALGSAALAVEHHLPRLVEERFASRLFARDPSLWGPDAQARAARRLGWVDLPRSSRPLVGQVAALREQQRTRGLDRVLLCGTGGSTLAAEVVCATAGVDLTVLDSTDPEAVRAVLAGDLARTTTVIASQSGATVETAALRAAVVAAYEEAGLDPARHLVAVTDPDSPLEQAARAASWTVVRTDPEVDGRYGALGACGLVPAGLAGADVARLLDEAEEIADLLAEDDLANPGLRLGCALGGTEPLRSTLLLTDQGSGLVGLADWVEQLLAASTGKEGRGLLPVVVGTDPDPTAAIPHDEDLAVVAFTTDPEDDEEDTTPTAEVTGSAVTVCGPLGAQLLLWEVAAAAAARLLEVDPFDEPGVAQTKDAARRVVDASPETTEPLTDGHVQVRAGGGSWWTASADADLASALTALVDHVDPQTGYLAVMVYLDRRAYADTADLREVLTERTGRPVTFGWGPRVLHSTGPLLKGGPATGVFLQVTGEPADDLPVPGEDLSFGELLTAQARADAQALADAGRPVLRLHLTDRTLGLQQVRRTLEGS